MTSEAEIPVALTGCPAPMQLVIAPHAGEQVILLVMAIGVMVWVGWTEFKRGKGRRR